MDEFPAYRADDLSVKLVTVALASGGGNDGSSGASESQRIVANAAVEIALPAAAIYLGERQETTQTRVSTLSLSLYLSLSLSLSLLLRPMIPPVLHTGPARSRSGDTRGWRPACGAERCARNAS